MNRVNLILLAYGRETECYRAIFCVLSFTSWVEDLKNVRIIIYTDKPGSFSPFLDHIDIKYHLLTPLILDDMLAGTGFFHRRKVAVVDLTFKNFPEDDLLFIDSDTFFIAAPKEILDGFEYGKSFMHKKEYDFEEGLKRFRSFKQGEYPEAFLKFIAGRPFKINGKTEIFTSNDYSWNSGVLGLNKEFSSVMPDVFMLTDLFYANSKWFISEQLAFSLTLQRLTEIKPTDQYVLHYWGNRQKLLMDELIHNFLTRTTVRNLRNKKLVRTTSKSFKAKVEIDIVIEEIEIARKHDDNVYIFKRMMSLILNNTFNLYAYKKLFKTLSKKLNLVQLN